MPSGAWTTATLIDRPEFLPVLAGWFARVWAPYYGPGGGGDALADLRCCNNRQDVPMCLVALDTDGRPLGTAALKAESVASPPKLTPWLAALTANPDIDCPEIEIFLIGAIETAARRAGYRALYTGSDPEAPVLTARGWVPFRRTRSLRGPMSLYRLDLQ